MKFSMTGQENVTFKYRWLLNRGDHMGRFDHYHWLILQEWIYPSIISHWRQRIHSDTGSHNRLDLIQSLVLTHSLCIICLQILDRFKLTDISYRLCFSFVSFACIVRSFAFRSCNWFVRFEYRSFRSSV